MVRVFTEKFSNYEAPPECPLSTYRRQKLINCQNENLRLKQIVTEFFLLKSLLSVTENIQVPLNIEINENGKPYIPDCPWKFSISHSGDALVIAVSDEEIGVDCEEEVPEEKIKAISERFFSKEEQEFCKDSATFTEVWTKKEAYAKMLGITLADILDVSILDRDIYHTVAGNLHIAISTSQT